MQISVLEWIELVIRFIIMYAYYYALRRLLKQPDHNPLSACNLLLVVVDMVFIILATAHDYAAKIAEFETFGEIGLELFMFIQLIRTWLQTYIFCLISILQLIAIYTPGHYRGFTRWKSGFCIGIAILLATAPSTISPSAVFIVDPMTNRTGESVRRAAMSRLKINVDTRLAIAFTYILVETIAITAYFKVIQ
ncbi:unnamed protein product, partial [Mesorhabditis spiculigera]